MPKRGNKQLNLELGKSNRPKIKIDPDATTPYGSDIQEAEERLRHLKMVREQEQEAARIKQELQDQRLDFMELHQSVKSKLATALPQVDTEIVTAKQDLVDLDQARKHFKGTLAKLNEIVPDSWSDEELQSNIERYELILEQASEDYDRFVEVLNQEKVVPSQGVTRMNAKTSTGGLNLVEDFMRGFAFTLPLIVTLLVIYFTKG